MKQATIDKENNIIEIKFRVFDPTEWKQTLELVKTLSGREFLPKEKLWKAPALQDNIDILKNAGFDFGTNGGTAEPAAPVKDEWKDTIIPAEMFPDLRPYQLDGLRFLEWRKGRGLITDEMGLGKTPQALSYLKMNPDKRPVLIVVPASIKLQWLWEYRRWTGSGPLQILSGRTPYMIPDENSVIINWDILHQWCAREEQELDENGVVINTKVIWDGPLMNHHFQIIIGDEFQAIGSSKSLRTKAFKKLARKIPHFIGLSGTPIRSRPAQFFSALSLVNKEQFSNEWKFKWRYCEPKNNGFGMDFKGASHIEELHELVSRVMIRRRKADVLKDLPAKMRTVVPLEIANLDKYRELHDQFVHTDSRQLELQQQFEALKWSAFDTKREMVVRWIKDFLDSGEKLVVYAYHRAVVQFLHNAFKDVSVKLDGGTPAGERSGLVQRFAEDPEIQLFIGNIQAAGVGIDGLQKSCSNAAFVEFAFTPSDHAQAEDRLHRIGQDGSVNIWYLIAPGTIEDDLMDILDSKMKIIEAIIDGTEPGDMDLFSELKKRYKI